MRGKSEFVSISLSLGIFKGSDIQTVFVHKISKIELGFLGHQLPLTWKSFVHPAFSQVYQYLCFTQAHLEETEKKINRRIQKRERDLQELREAVESHKVRKRNC